MKVFSSQKVVQALLLLLVVGVWGLLLGRFMPVAKAAPAASAPTKQILDELTVQRINIVDRNGKTRLIIANADRFPNPVVRGKPVTRSIHTTAGMVFYDGEGNEAGGLATAKGPKGHEMVALILDYGYQPTDGIGLVKSESADGKNYTAGLTIADRLPYKPGDIETSEGVSRIWLANENQDAHLEIADTSGKPRIRLGVGRNDVPFFEILDASGKVVSRLPAD